MVSASFATNATFHGCYATVKNDTLRVGNSLVERRWLLNGGALVPVSIINKSVFPLRITSMKDIEKTSVLPASYDLSIEKSEETAISHASLSAVIISDYPDYRQKTIISIYPGSPAIRIQYAFRLSAGHEAPDTFRTFTLDRISLPSLHYTLKSVEFFDRTDVNNNLVDESTFLPFTTVIRKKGNVLLATTNTGYDSYFILKEAPCSFVQLNYPGYDFEIDRTKINVVGSGLAPSDLSDTAWTPSYSAVIGVSSDKYPIEYYLRAYQKHIRNHNNNRDEMIMMNTWGDRNRDASVGEEFCLREIDACVKYGVTHFQIDDGWQAGASTNSANPKGRLWNRWTVDDWQPNAERFPNGFKKVVDYAEKNHIKPGLWFHPSNADSYQNWQQDAEIVAGLYHDYGIRYFKIDGISLPDKLAEVNLRKFFERVLELTGNQVVFDVDATANSRGGYHYLNRYGNIFLENRYTDWGKYYPHWTLRNLWQLSAYVPPELLQVEFLNKWRNPGKYPAGDSLAPAFIPFDYQFAVTMAGQPLAWFEGSNLPDEAQSVIPVIEAYKKVWHDFHNGTILPIGDMPDGSAWTGFQSVNNDHGYFLVFREKNLSRTNVFKTMLNPGTKISLTMVTGDGEDHNAVINTNGGLEFSLPGVFTFALYRYDVKDL